MKGLAELVVSLFDLCEAEGRLLQESILATARHVGLLFLGLLFGAAALALLLAALYALLNAFLSAEAVLGILGAACAVIALFCFRGARGPVALPLAQPEAEKTAEDAQTRSGATSPEQGEKARAGVWASARPYGESRRGEA